MRNGSIKILIGFFALLFIIGVVFFVNLQKEKYKKQTINIKGQEIDIDVARTLEKRAKGFSGRQNLLNNEGMLFIFDEEGKHGFWMKEMNFPIDIIWIDKECIVASIKENASPQSFPEIFYPERNVKYVLEIKAKRAMELNLIVGDRLNCENFITLTE